ncbi:MAG: hypothetical protein PVJ61_05150 [Dehalococcoidia bacterium]|jgi:hypothetical protein
MNNLKSPDGNEKEVSLFEKKLAHFLRRNKDAKIEKKGDLYYITNVWNQKNLSILLDPASESELVAALNNLILPPRFAAIYHVDTNIMEYIFTFLDRNSPYLSRQFEFNIEDEVYHCAFQEASERLLLISKLARPTGGMGDDRNLMLLNMYTNPDFLQTLGLKEDLIGDSIPVSFFVSKFEAFDENKIVRISKHLNFLMQYYDRKTTYILIYPPESSEVEPEKQLRFVETDFPKNISTKYQNPVLLDLMLTANEAATRLKFIYYYQILEYAAFYYIEDNIKRNLLQLIKTPDIFSNLDKYLPMILDTVSEKKQDDVVKIEKIIRANCFPEIIWREIEHNIPYFSQRQEFEGGFAIEPIIPPDTTLESFIEGWHARTATTLRVTLSNIRNALVHAREKTFGVVITPTSDNDRKIRPWIPVIRRLAEHVIIFG